VSSQYANRFFGSAVADVDPQVEALIRLEEERQKRRIILIPSESYAPQPVREALGSVFTNVYAEGYPPRQMVDNDEGLLADLAQQLSYYRRYADRRFYKGADYVHLIETLAQRRAAACFANERASADQIFVNVQPLSGAAANLAVYDALMVPGDTLMGMDLFQGGHLTHGSEFNVSGKRYNVVSYGVSSGHGTSGQDGRLDYDEIRELAETSRPKVIIAGYTSYPWAPDFCRFREIADAVGAYLLADIAHPAGMAIAGQYPNPVGIADVVTFTTHKTLCGPRGACILTTDKALASRIDASVFPGLQGGPHTNKFAAMGVAFEIARSDAFRDLQRRIVENARALAGGLTRRGLELAYGGTDTHLLLLDLKSVQREGARPNGEAVLYGEVVARILELAGIVVNKQTIPGDTVTALATGIRMGTPWVTQRGMGPEEMDKLASGISRIVQGIVPFSYEGLRRELPRGKIDLDALEEVKWSIDEMACVAQAEIECGCSTYPHYCLRPSQIEPPEFLLAAGTPALASSAGEGLSLIDLSDLGVLGVSGWRAQPLLEDVCTVDIAALEPGQGTRSFLLDGNGSIIDDVVIWRLARDRRGRDQYLVTANPENTEQVLSWLRGLSDGYILFDDQDVWRKVRGPAKVETLGDAAFAIRGPQARGALSRALGDPAGVLDAAEGGFSIVQIASGEHTVWVTHDDSVSQDAWYGVLGPVVEVRAIWEALLEAGARPLEVPRARHAWRARIGLPPVWPTARQEPGRGDLAERDACSYCERLPHLFDMSKPYFVGQSKLPQPNDFVDKRAFTWADPVDAPRVGDPLMRTPLYEEHKDLGARMTAFAGYEMPVWYSSVGDEHQAVRERAGLFDVGHMGTIEVSGPHAVHFLDLVGVNYAWWIKDGESLYGGLLDAEGQILDDMIFYRRAWDRFLVVVNAANFAQDWAWLNAVNNNEVIIDRQRPWVDLQHPATLRNLKDPSSGPDQRIDIALQGPHSLQILLSCASDLAFRGELARLQRTRFVEGVLEGIELLVARTGYTGEDMGFELYVHPDQAASLWRLLLERGASYGIKPCGLAARDSARIEAGLPLYGHELAGPLGITPNEAGFASYVKYHKPFFVGRAPYKAYNDASARCIARFQVSDKGARALRGGEPVVSRRGKVIGNVTSCALVGERQIGMALVEARYTEPGTPLFVYPETRRTGRAAGRKAVSRTSPSLELGDTVTLPVEAHVITRFPEKR
jgi:glycine cleavage system T protein